MLLVTTTETAQLHVHCAASTAMYWNGKDVPISVLKGL